jgi:hypothetical protein
LIVAPSTCFGLLAPIVQGLGIPLYVVGPDGGDPDEPPAAWCPRPEPTPVASTTPMATMPMSAVAPTPATAGNQVGRRRPRGIAVGGAALPGLRSPWFESGRHLG